MLILSLISKLGAYSSGPSQGGKQIFRNLVHCCRLPDITRAEESITWETHSDERGFKNASSYCKNAVHAIQGLDNTIINYCGGNAFEYANHDLFFL